MYPAPFTYHRAHSVDQAIDMLGQIGEGARVLAGGQSLLPILKLRFDEPTDLVDVGRIEGLNGIELGQDDIRIGALATHRRIAASDVAGAIPIVSDCANGIADNQVRSRGTIGGSVASGDPSCDWPVLLHTLDAKVHSRGPNGERTRDINGFVSDLYETVLDAGEIITGVQFALPGSGSGGAYCAFKRCAPAYPSVSVGVQLVLSGGEVSSARIALGSSAPTPVRAREAESELEGGAITPDRVSRAAEAAVAAADPFPDQRGSAGFKRQLIATLVRRATGIAERRAKGETVKNSHEYY
ncbi:FAD binding domain-containing protein [Elongatibacter sediminis]|uniref:Xanthine dehydrogenase family protein subunit M n=1 Tax=Elongatibacter sediminis TaxID=3119006 RepID=A0AAW9R9J6_9GAMM